MRTIGGDDDSQQANFIRTLVAHFPSRWSEVNRVTVSVAVEEATAPDKGLFVIFLPTDMPTGTAAHINAPFYGSLDRRQIDLSDSYNEFLLATVLDLILDTVAYLVSTEPGRLASTSGNRSPVFDHNSRRTRFFTHGRTG